MKHITTAFHRAANVPRSALYLTEHDPQMPAHLPDDARSPFLGFCGERWQPGGTVLLAINPGGGGASYQSRNPHDAELIPLIQEFKNSATDTAHSAFMRMCSSYQEQVQNWNLWRILGPTLEACACSLDQVCYLNIFPYRTARDAKPSQPALRNAWAHITQPLLASLKPGRLVALGKKAGNVAAELYTPPPRLFVIPRTIGDTYISEEAHVVLGQLRRDAT